MIYKIKINKNKSIFDKDACEYISYLKNDLKTYGFNVSNGAGLSGKNMKYYLFINDKEVLSLYETKTRAVLETLVENEVVSYAVGYIQNCYAVELKYANVE